jgi:2-polyprenyl-3-methyl-5-hydroxy-6-metoxy-1,4-benzoquinol methylase
MAEPLPHPESFVWQRSLDIEAQDAAHYLDYVNRPLLEMIAGSPGRVLELGCAAGSFGKHLKDRHPGTKVTGIEPGRAAADVAATRIDRVIRARFEDADFAAEGLAAGSFDTVIAADVLEHMPNPWAALVRVKPLLAPGGQLVASIPNVRNLALLGDALLNGRWTYLDRGLLDITHLRFFTLAEIRAMFEQTGYRLEHYGANISPNLLEVFNRNRGRPLTTLQLGRLTLTDVTAQELLELCAEQFLVRVRVE